MSLFGKTAVAGVACALAVWAWSARGDGASPTEAAELEAEEEAAQNPDLYSGISVALNASDILAPEASFKVGGRNWNWGGLKIQHLTGDGEEVKAGAVIARFDFFGREALQSIQEGIQRAEATRGQAKITGEQQVEGLQVEQRRLTLEAALAAIDIRRERAISRKQASLFRIRHKIAQFEADAVKQRVASSVRTHHAEMAYQDMAVSRAQQDLARYKFYEGRFQAVAPHDGVVRHAFNSRERRKVQKGDSVGSGQKLISVAKDTALAVRFFVPEHRIHEVREGMGVKVTSLSGDELRGRITRVDFFPQELGFLMEQPTLPNAREKAFAVQAVLEDAPETLTAGRELRVKVDGGAPIAAGGG